MGKPALCIHIANAPVSVRHLRMDNLSDFLPIPDDFYKTPTVLGDRTFVETDESLQQLIPYIAIVRGDTLYTYSRGDGSEESRLRGQLSVGLGGHVDSSPTTDLLSHLQEEAARELLEEALLTVNPAEISFRGLLVDSSTSVQRVHLGLFAVYRLQEHDVIVPESKVVEKGEFLSLEILRTPEIYNRLEMWSRIVVDELTHGISV